MKPFKFHLDQRLGHKAGDPPPSDGPIVPMAEFVNKYHKATPPRFRRTAKKPQQLNEGAAASLTVPRTPQLSTKTRARPSIVKSAAVIEQEELDKIRQWVETIIIMYILFVHTMCSVELVATNDKMIALADMSLRLTQSIVLCLRSLVYWVFLVRFHDLL